MSAAHELIERDFQVEIYEKQSHYVGGKARSIDVPGSAKPGNKPLPGEHGFRFFPGFYQHVTDTMKRIPFANNQNGVFDNLVATQRVVMGREGMNEIVTLVNFPKSKKDIEVITKALGDSHTGLEPADYKMMAAKIWQLMTSSKERRLNDYERMAWWEFTEANYHSEAYSEFFVGGLTRTLVAAKPRRVSTRTGGDILLQLIYQMSNPLKRTDRVLNAPTNEAWLNPWYKHLTEGTKNPVNYHHGYEAQKIHCKREKEGKFTITGVDVIDEKGKVSKVTGDYYIMAVPVEVMGKLLIPVDKKTENSVVRADPTLGTIRELANDVAWMTGIQFYLNVDIPITKGHVMIIDAPWAVTIVSQPQFWHSKNMSTYGNGTVKGLISVDVSDWDAVGFNGKTAKECTKQEFAQEIWCQITLGLLVDDKPIFNNEMLVDCFLDRDIRDKNNDDPLARENIIDVSKIKACPKDLLKNLPDKYKTAPSQQDNPSEYKTINEEPLLVNRINTWNLRPEAWCTIPNLFFAADYVRTHTDLASMEGANEAARRAVNRIIEVSGSKAKKSKIWDMHEPLLLAPFRWHDRRRYRKGMAWREDFPWIIKLFHSILSLFKK
jgi:uncharacterized protein with NAD-binding domain and iron-sulfur cluster